MKHYKIQRLIAARRQPAFTSHGPFETEPGAREWARQNGDGMPCGLLETDDDTGASRMLGWLLPPSELDEPIKANVRALVALDEDDWEGLLQALQDMQSFCNSPEASARLAASAAVAVNQTYVQPPANTTPIGRRAVTNMLLRSLDVLLDDLQVGAKSTCLARRSITHQEWARNHFTSSELSGLACWRKSSMTAASTTRTSAD